jgi:Holliday junction resolvase YEN1
MGDIEEEGEASSTAKRKSKNRKYDISATKVTHNASPRKSKILASLVRPRNMPMTPTTQKLLDYIEISNSEESELSPPTSTRPREPAPNQSMASHVIDLGSPEPSDQESDSRIPDLFQGFGANTLPLDVSDEEDEELQLALRLSMQDQDFTINRTQGSSRLPSSNQGKYERIFAMREAGRDTQGFSVPAWSLDQTISVAIPSRAAQTPCQGVENGPSYTSNAPIRGVHAGLIGREPVDVPDWSQQRAAVPSEPAVSLSESSTKGHVDAIPGPSPADIRAARLRHFATSSPDPAKNANESRPSPLAVFPKKRSRTTYQVPMGIECIDLTGD